MKRRIRPKSLINLLTIDVNGEILNPDFDAYDQVLFSTEMSVPEYRSFQRSVRISHTLEMKNQRADRLAELERRKYQFKNRF